jgi:hypothetical protein
MTSPPKLLGEYVTPRFDYGDVVECARRGEVRIVGLSEAPIPWPVGQTLPRGKGRALVLYGDLAEAVARESSEAVMHFWGVKVNTVWLWRKALNVGRYTEGTRALMSERLSPVLQRTRVAAAPTWSGPERREKIAAALRGKAKPAHVVEAMRKGRTGKSHDEQAREKMSRAHRQRGTLVPGAEVWTAEEDEAVRTLAPAEAVKRTGRTLAAVWSRRRFLKLPDGRAARPRRGQPLSEAQILAWARTYREAKGKWPNAASPPEHLPEGESWRRLDVSLRRGQRGLPGGSSLSRLLRGRR